MVVQYMRVIQHSLIHNSKLILGTGSDLQIYHDSNTFINATAGGTFTIDALRSDTDIIFKGTDNTTDITANLLWI